MPIVSGGGGGGTAFHGGVITQSLIADGDSSVYLEGLGATAAQDSGPASSLYFGAPSGTGGGNTALRGGNATSAAGSSGDALMAAGDSFDGHQGARIYTQGGVEGVRDGSLFVRALGAQGVAGQALTSNGASATVWNTLGAIKCDTHAAPADGVLAAGELYLWFDQTNGAAKLMVKAKTADGTVVAASIALA